jgi:DNA-binding transcriptional MocR family regulator
LVDDAVADLRRSLGPTAWFVFEELLWSAEMAQGKLQVQISTRALAATLGSNKDTVTRALGRLRNAGVVVRAQRDDVTGKSRFLMFVPESLYPTVAPVEADRRTVRDRRARRRRENQLSLLE